MSRPECKVSVEICLDLNPFSVHTKKFGPDAKMHLSFAATFRFNGYFTDSIETSKEPVKKLLYGA